MSATDEKVAVEKKADDHSYDTHQLIVFKQGTEEYALHIDQIKEVVITPNITKMPQAPEFIRGVANIRGSIIAIVDLEQKFGIKDSDKTLSHDTEKDYTLVIESEDMKIGILVKNVPNTLAISEKDIDEGLNIVSDSNADKNYIKGIVKIKERLVILIDIFKVMDKSDLGTVKADAA